jgi:hypothetical protein
VKNDIFATVEGLAQGKMIVPDYAVNPVLQEPPAPTRDELIAEAEKTWGLIDALQSVRYQLANERAQTDKEGQPE